ncbi:MAG: hypothetical protein QM756_46990 [Polyangiaceae bacterium]
MFTADCDQCGARNELPASVQDEGINSGSLIPCAQCGAEACVRLTVPSLPPVELLPETEPEPRTTPRAESQQAQDEEPEHGEDEATQVLEPSRLPDAAPIVTAIADMLEDEPPTNRRVAGAEAEAEVRAEAADDEGAPQSSAPTSADLIDSAPDSLVPLSTRDFVTDEGKAPRHVPVPPPREVHAAVEEAPMSFGTPTLAALVRNATPPPAPRRGASPAEADVLTGQDVLVPPAGPIDELFDARVIPLLRTPTATEAPVASVSRPPEAPKEAPRSNGALGFGLLVAGVAFVAGLAVKNAKDTEAAAPALPVATPMAEAAPVAPLPVAPQAASPALLPAPEQQPGETPAEATPPPALAAPDVAAPAAAPVAPSPAPQTAADVAPKTTTPVAAVAPAQNLPRSAAPVRSAPVAAEAPPVTAAFDSAAAGNALNAAAQRASSCKTPSDPSGVAVVTITFSPSGRVTSANISGPPFAGTETGGCIASMLRGVKVPAYSGDFMTVKKTINVQ